MSALVVRIGQLAEAVRAKFNAIAPRLLPAGGITGQRLVKTSDTEDYKVAWAGKTQIVNVITAADGTKALTFSGFGTARPMVVAQVIQTGAPSRATTVEVSDLTASGCTLKAMRSTSVLPVLSQLLASMEPLPAADVMVRIEAQ